MLKTVVSRCLVAACVGIALFAFTPERGLAVGDEPQKPEPKPKPGSKPKPKPKPKQKDSALDQDQIYSLGYWQAKRGEHEAALVTLRSAADQNDPRVQTMIGFALRKLGKVDEGMIYYRRVLAAHPDRITTRQYLGEAFLQVGDVASAREQLGEIAKRCGMACEDYQLLAEEIAKHERAAG
jgi:predicted Zn-dependent protease